MKPAFIALCGALVGTSALAAVPEAEHPDNAEREVDWRNERPGWGVGLSYGPMGPGVSLRGWSSAVLSVDVGAGVEQGREEVSGGVESRRTLAWVNVAPRVRVYGSQKTDVLVVPAIAYDYASGQSGGVRSQDTAVRGSIGVAVDRWVAPGVTVTGRIDAAQLAYQRSQYGEQTLTGSSTRLALTPSIAVHVYPEFAKRN